MCVCVCESKGIRSTAQETDSQGIGKERTGIHPESIYSDIFYVSEAGVATPMLALKFSRSGRKAATALEQKGLTQ